MTSDYTKLYRYAERRLDDPRAVGWAEVHGIAVGTLEAVGAGFVDPTELEASAIIGGIEGTGVPRYDRPFVIVPAGPGCWTGFLVSPVGALDRIRPPASEPGIWNEDALRLAGDGPLLIVSDLMDALLLYQAGADVVRVDNVSYRLLAQRLRAGPPSGPVVLLPPSPDPDDIGAMEGMAGLFLAEGAAVVCYDSREDRPPVSGMDPEGLGSLIARVGEWAAEGTRRDAAELEALSNAGYVGSFRSMIANRRDPATPTGFERLDGILDGGLRTGLYVLGAMSSFGKTSLALQIADNVAARGRDVLFFSVEQSKAEIVSKSLSRMCAGNADPRLRTPYRPNDILYRYSEASDDTKRCIDEVLAQYAEDVAPRMFVAEDASFSEPEKTGRIGLDTIEAALKRHARARDPPLVVVDYLQILRSDDERATDKQRVDDAVTELRMMARRYGVPILAISSVNRGAYNQPLSYGAFKESGAIEYGADVLIGMAPDGMTTNEDNNRKLIDYYRGESEKQVLVEVMKNRMGSIGGVVMDYDAAYGLFTELRGRPGETN